MTPTRYEHELDEIREQRDDLRKALQRIADGGSCRCEHDDENCCANVDYWCPECISAAALAKADGRA